MSDMTAVFNENSVQESIYQEPLTTFVQMEIFHRALARVDIPRTTFVQLGIFH